MVWLFLGPGQPMFWCATGLSENQTTMSNGFFSVFFTGAVCIRACVGVGVGVGVYECVCAVRFVLLRLCGIASGLGL